MKQKNLALLTLAVLLIPSLNGCEKKEQAMHVNEIEPYLYEVDTYTSLDYDFADNFYASENDNWSGGGCSCITKMIEGDRRIFGRNMDLNISENCAYVIKTAVPDKYKTIGLQYTFRDVSPKYADVKAHGISSKWSKLLPFYQDDVMNERGFHIEVNMRHGEYDPAGNDLFAVESTNPNGSRRVHMFELPIYIAQNCATVEDAKSYVSSLDIYSKNHYWNYCFIMADATGAAALLEFCNYPLNWASESPKSPIHWIEEENLGSTDFSYLNDYADTFGTLEYNAIAQTNFFINEDGFYYQDTKSGFGRMKTMQEGISRDGQTIVKGINEVSSKQDMYDLMKAVSYGNFYQEYQDCKNNHFDPRSEQLAEGQGLTSKFIYEDEARFEALQNAYIASVPTSREEKRAANVYWESTFTEVVDIKDKTIFVRFFERSDMEYVLSFNGFSKATNGIQ